MPNRTWFYAAGIRAIKTFAQAALSILLVAKVTDITQINWWEILSVGVIAAVISLLTSLKGLPEVNTQTDGTVTVNLTDPEKDVYHWNMNDLADLETKETVTFKVVRE